MHIKKNMINKELRGKYFPLKLLTKVVSKKWGINLMNFASRFSNGKGIKGIHSEEKYISSNNGGPDIRIRIFKPENMNEDLPIMLYCHGGGYIIGNPELALSNIKDFINTRACIVVAPDYRKALDAPFPAALNDCYDTLLWVKENQKILGSKLNKFIVAGHSAGGGLTAAITLKARDTRDVKIAFQLPIYPMIDDRQNTESAKNSNAPVWNSQTNQVGWNLYLKDLRQNKKAIPTYAAPARNNDYSNFPPTITFVGDMEPFKDETITYVKALKKEGVPVDFKLYKGCFHGFEIVHPEALISKKATAFLLDSFGRYMDTYYK